MLTSLVGEGRNYHLGWWPTSCPIRRQHHQHGVRSTPGEGWTSLPRRCTGCWRDRWCWRAWFRCCARDQSQRTSCRRGDKWLVRRPLSRRWWRWLDSRRDRCQLGRVAWDVAFLACLPAIQSEPLIKIIKKNQKLSLFSIIEQTTKKNNHWRESECILIFLQITRLLTCEILVKNRPYHPCQFS